MSKLLSVLVAALVLVPSLAAQYAPGKSFSPNVHLMTHVPLAKAQKVSDIEVEQDLSRPYAYVSRGPDPIGFDIVSIRNPAHGERIYSWAIENPELHQGRGVNGKYFKLKGRYYYVQAVQIRAGSPDHDLSTIIFDVTGLPDTSKIKEVGRIRVPDAPGGAHNLFPYKHSDGRVLLFFSVESPAGYPYGALVYDMEKFLAGAPDKGFVTGMPLPEPRAASPAPGAKGYHDQYVAYDVANHRDLFYGGGPETSPLGGNFVYDITDLKNPKLIATVIAQSSMQSGGHTFVATPDGRYAMTIMTSPAHQPVRLWDLKPALDGTTPVIKTPIGEWSAETPNKSGHMIELRWPYAFIADYEQGLRVLDIRNPTDPVEVGFYDTYNYRIPFEPGGVAFGAYGLDVRNADGMIVVADDYSGFWAFKMDGFDGWNGRDWGMPNVSSVQDWDNGPEGAPRPQKVSSR